MRERSHEADSMRGIVFPVPMVTIPADDSSMPYQNENQRKVELLATELTDKYSHKLGLSRRDFLRSSSGMTVVFLAMNSVFGELFAVSPAEAADPAFAQERKKALADQFIFDMQTHFVSASSSEKRLLELRERAKKWNPELKGEKEDPKKIGFDNYYKEIYEMSDTKMAVLSSAPNDDPKKWFAHNDELANARDIVNQKAGRKAQFSHALFTPGFPGWLEEIDRAISEFKPNAWKGYTVGAPFDDSKYPWKLDDEKLVYPAYEKMVKAGIVNVCIHKGLLPSDYKVTMAKNWKYGMVEDLGKAAKDWPQLNFLIYHSAIEYGEEPTEEAIREFEDSGRIPWVTELAQIPAKFGVRNVYAEIGSTFAISAVSAPRYCAGILGTLIKGLGADHVLWGTDSVIYGSPQWQIEAFRRIEIPKDIQKKFDLAPLGAAEGEVKTRIFGANAATLHNVRV
jgi:uncharacterized protein